MVFVLRPGYRIGRWPYYQEGISSDGVSNLIVSFGESSNLCIFGIIFIDSYFGFIHVRF
jgi:hypothetical protein